MCTSPNYLVFNGKFSEYTKNKDGSFTHHEPRPKFDFYSAPVFEKLVKENLLFVEVPCGKCLDCRIQQSRAWADRCVLEAKKSPHNYFVTLTYNNENYPDAYELDGVKYAAGSLKRKDITDFVKRLRSRFPGVKIRTFYSGEYGIQDLRPHFHILLFNCPLDDLSHRFKRIENGKKTVNRLDNPKYFFSDIIWDSWQRKGDIVVAYFDYQCANYVAQYCTKKTRLSYDDDFLNLGLHPEFIGMSRRPGLGADYFDPKLYDLDSIVIGSSNGAHTSSLPRYYDKLFIKKYGQDVFDNSIGSLRLAKKFQRINNEVHSNCIKSIKNEYKASRLNSKFARNEKL